MRECPECPATFERKRSLFAHRTRAHGWRAPHGHVARYHGGCRCGPCTEANRRYKAMRFVPTARSYFTDSGRTGVDRDIAGMCEDRDDPADPRRLDRLVLHARARHLAVRSHPFAERLAVAR